MSKISLRGRILLFLLISFLAVLIFFKFATIYKSQNTINVYAPKSEPNSEVK